LVYPWSILGLTPRTLLPSFRVVGIVLSLRRSLQRPSSPSSPARPIHRPRSEHGQIGQDASREVSPVPFSVHWSRRTVRSYHTLDHPASALFWPRHPRQGVSSPMRFFCASRLRCFQFRAVETPPARVIRGRFFARHTYRTRGSGSYRDLTGIVKIPVTLVGFTYCPSQFCSRPRVRTPLGAHRTHLPFRHLPPRVSSSRGPPLTVDQGFMAAAPGVWPRVNEPCRVIRRPRHGFYAQGRSNPPADTALGFQILSRVFVAGLRSPPLEPFRPWAFRATGQRFCRDHVVMPHAPFGVMGGRTRLAGPAVFPFGSASPSKVFAPAIERSPTRVGAMPCGSFFKDHKASFAAEAPVEMNLFRSLQIPQIDHANPAKNCGKCSLF
jgi:hypothetical protein